MPLAFATYFEVNLLINLFILFFLAAYFLHKNAILYITLIALVLTPYLYPVPKNWSKDNKTPQFTINSIHAQSASQDTSLSSDSSSSPVGNLLNSAQQGDALATIGNVTKLYEDLGKDLTGNESFTIPDPVSTPSQTSSKETSGFSFDSIRTAINPPNHQSKTIKLSGKNVLKNALDDPEALWLFVRCFWLLAAFIVYIQASGHSLGLNLFALNLLPMPFLAEAVPFYWHSINSHDWTLMGNHLLKNPQIIAQAFENPDTSKLLYPAIAFAVILGILLLFKLLKRIQRNELEEFMNPERFQIEVFEELRDFHIAPDGNIVAGDLSFDPRSIRFDAEDKRRWYLSTGTLIQFVERPEYAAQLEAK